MGKRVALERAKFAAVIQVWLRKLPAWAWGTDPAYEKARAEKRHDPANQPDPKRMVAELIAEEIGRLGWEVTYEQQENIFSEHWPREGEVRCD